MGAVVVQSASAHTTGGTATATFGAGTTAGNTIIVYASNASTASRGVTDNKSGGSSTYATADSNYIVADARQYSEIRYVENCAAGITAVSLDVNYTGEGTITAIEVSGLKTSASLDKTAKGVGAYSTADPTAWSTSSTGALSQADEFAVIGVSNFYYTQPVSFSGTAGFTDVANFGAAGLVQYKITSATTALTGGGNISGVGDKDSSAVLATFKVASSASPNITGGTANPAHGSTGNTITGTNFGATQGAGSLAIGGQAQTVTSWSATSITYTANRGINLDNVAVNAVVTDNSLVASSDYALTGFAVPAGYYVTTLTSVNSTAANRITAVSDPAIGDQIEWDAALVTVANDGTFTADPAVTSFNVRVGVSGSGWGALALQTINLGVGGGATGGARKARNRIYAGLYRPRRL